MPETSESTGADRRRGARRRRRLHPARLTDEDGRYLAEGALADLSQEGARLRLAGLAELPDRVLVFDETARRIAAARVMWTRGLDVGLGIEDWRPVEEVAPALRRRLLSAYYARE